MPSPTRHVIICVSYYQSNMSSSIGYFIPYISHHSLSRLSPMYLINRDMSSFLYFIIYQVCHPSGNLITHQACHYPAGILSHRVCHHLCISSLLEHVIPHLAYHQLHISSLTKYVIIYRACHLTGYFILHRAFHHLMGIPSHLICHFKQILFFEFVKAGQ